MGDVFELGDQGEGTMVGVRFNAPKSNAPSGLVAEGELWFTGGLFHGLKLVGVGIWKRRDGQGFNATLPSRSYQVNGEKRTFILLRPQNDGSETLLAGLAQTIIGAYTRWAK